VQSSHPIAIASDHLSVADRIESFKAGFLGAIASVFAILLLENIAWLAIVQSILETAIQQKWIAAFGSAKD